MASQPIVTIEQWFTEGWKLYKRHPVTFFFASLLGALICIPPGFLFFAGPLYAGLYYMALKAMRGEKPPDSRHFQRISPILGGPIPLVVIPNCTHCVEYNDGWLSSATALGDFDVGISIVDR